MKLSSVLRSVRVVFPIVILLANVLSITFADEPKRVPDDYKLGMDSQWQAEVPKGKLIQDKWVSEKIYPRTECNYWVYTPAQYDGAKAACLMVFQDGGGYAKSDVKFRIPVVFDNLIHKIKMPITIGIFLNPGTVPAAQSGQKGTEQSQFRI